MKSALYILLSVMVLGCGASAGTITQRSDNVSGPEGVKGRMIIPSDSTLGEGKMLMPPPVPLFSDEVRMKGIVNFLASDQLKGRDPGTPEMEKAMVFLENIFRQNRVKPYFETYLDTVLNVAKPAYNIVGFIEGTDRQLKDEYIVIGAHYDHIGVLLAVNGDSIANGANDNASGTAIVLELLRYFGSSRTNKRSLIFALFSAEEQGLLGSRHLATRLKADGIDLYTMLNFEMTGVPMTGKDYLLFVTGYEMSNLAQVCNSYAGKNLIGFLPSAREFNLFQRSDNFPFHEVFRVPSQTFCTFDFTNYKYYHQAADEASEMDFDHMANVVNNIIPVIEGISNSPSRVIRYN